MTVGEKIQYYRKKSGLSQEELGQKLLVSRQTVSLWEMDKTLPTVDNLIRLKEIFSVAVDDILSESEITEEVMEEQKEEVKESYQFQYSEWEMHELFKNINIPLQRRLILYSVAYIAIIFILVIIRVSEISVGVIIGYLLADFYVRFRNLRAFKKQWCFVEKNYLESTYFYEIYDRYINLKITANEDIIQTVKIYHTDINEARAFGNFIVFSMAGQECVIKKDALSEDSFLLSVLKRNLHASEKKKSKGISKIVSIVLFVASIASVFGAMGVMTILDETNSLLTENMWVFFLFTPIPIASLIFGIFVKKDGCRYKKNIVIGIIMTALLCIYGSFTFIFGDMYSHNDEPIINAEELLNINIPEHTQINTQDWGGAQMASRGNIAYSSDVYFDDGTVENFEKRLSLSTKWIEEISTNLIGITSGFCDYQTYDYFIIYNINTGEYNSLPRSDGTYRFLNLLYDVDSNKMMIVEYEIEYKK